MTSLTGSLNVTGSTTQTGNNTLIGNTTLSGSINVSGSQNFNGSSSFSGNHVLSGSNTIRGNTFMFGNIQVSGSSNFNNSLFVVTGSSFFKGNHNVSGSTNVTGALNITGDLNVISGSSFFRWGNKLFNYGSFYHTASMNLLASGSIYSMSLSTTDFANGVSIGGASKSEITFANPGVYDIQFSAQITKTSGTKSNVYIWLDQNGSSVPNTNTDVTLAGGSGVRVVAAWNFFVKTTTPNEYAKLMYAGTVGNVQFLYETGSGVIPAIPSLIVTVNRVG